MNPITFTLEEANFLVKMIDLGLKSPQGGAVLATRAAIVLDKIGRAAPAKDAPAEEVAEDKAPDKGKPEEKSK
tara:strand:+ start:392 stop:610 length:219 start_codon:yes stop_codon:yes gene_type:complete